MSEHPAPAESGSADSRSAPAVPAIGATPRDATPNRRARWVDLFRQWPWIYPRGIADSAETWIAESQRRLGWYAGLRTDWCEHVHPGGLSVFEPPPRVPDALRAQFRQNASRRHPPAAVCFFTGAYVWSDEGVVLTRDNRVLADFHHHFAIQPLRRWIARRPFAMFRTHTRRIEEAVGLLAAPQGWNHYHWLFDVLPRLHLLERWRPVIERYLVPARLTAVQRESLALLGIAEGQLEPLHPRDRLRCQHLYAPSLPGSEGCSPPWVLAFLREVFPAAVATTPGCGPRLYVRRGATGERPVVNEDALIARLERRGFRAIDPAHLGFSEQVAAFRDAAVVVGAHGAGLANLAFCHRTAVLELLSVDYARADCYFTLCRQNGFPYDCWVDTGGAGPRPWAGIRADVDEIERRLDRLEPTLPASA